MQARKSLLFDNNKSPRQKQGANPMFDVTMGSFDGAEVCELVGLFLDVGLNCRKDEYWSVSRRWILCDK